MNESHLTYKDMRSLAQLLVRRRIALARATPEQRMCCEALRTLDKGANKESDAESARALRKIHEEALHAFTRRPDDAEEIYEKICNDIQGQVATRATQNALCMTDTGDVAGGRGAAHATKFYDFVEAHALLKKYCYRKVFRGKCDIEKCSFDHGAEGEAELRKDLGNEGFEQHKKQFERRTKAKHSSADKGSSKIDHNRHFNLTAPAHKQGLGLCMRTMGVESEQHNEASEPSFTCEYWPNRLNILTSFGVGSAITEAVSTVCSHMHAMYACTTSSAATHG